MQTRGFVAAQHASVRTDSVPHLTIYKCCIGEYGEDTVILWTGEGGAVPEKLVHYLTHRPSSLIQRLRGVVDGTCRGAVVLRL